MSSTNGTSAARIEANRRNAQKSTGPRSAEGKQKSRFNAVKHGMWAEQPVLPGEDPEVLQARHDEWQRVLKPKDDVDRFLVRRAVDVSWQLERADRACAMRLQAARAGAGRDEAVDEAELVAMLGRRLFWDRCGPIALYPHSDPMTLDVARVSWTEDARSSDAPEVLIYRLESLPLGCAWMIDRWTDLAGLIEDGLNWQPPDRLRAIRLLGGQPLDAVDDRRVMDIYLACSALEPEKPPAFNDLTNELTPDERARIGDRLRGRDLAAMRPADPEAARQALLALIGAEVERLEGLLAVLLERRGAAAAAQAEFDDSPTGDRLRSYQSSNSRTLLRILDTLRRRQREADQPEADTPASPLPSRLRTPAPPVGTKPNPRPNPATPAAVATAPTAAPPARPIAPAPAPDSPPAAVPPRPIAPAPADPPAAAAAAAPAPTAAHPATNPTTRPDSRDGEAPTPPSPSARQQLRLSRSIGRPRRDRESIAPRLRPIGPAAGFTDPARRRAASAASAAPARSTVAVETGPAATHTHPRSALPAESTAAASRPARPAASGPVYPRDRNAAPADRRNEPNPALANRRNEPNAAPAKRGNEPNDPAALVLPMLRKVLERMGAGASPTAILLVVALAAGWTLGPARRAPAGVPSPARPVARAPAATAPSRPSALSPARPPGEDGTRRSGGAPDERGG